MTPDWTVECRQLIDDCEARESRLTDWDRGFLDSIGKQLDRGIPLTPKQTEKLDEIMGAGDRERMTP